MEKSKLQTGLSVFSSSSAKWIFLNVANKEMTFFTFTHTKPTEIMGHGIYISTSKKLPLDFFPTERKYFLATRENIISLQWQSFLWIYNGRHLLTTMAIEKLSMEILSSDSQWKTIYCLAIKSMG